MSKNKLFVEGNDDLIFHQAFCKVIEQSQIEVKEIKVDTPKSSGIDTRNGWRGLIDGLPLIFKQLKSGDIEKVGIILDADFTPDNSGGVIARYIKVIEQLTLYGYSTAEEPNYGKGDIFKHPNGLPDFGLWIMPNHQDEGMLENFIEFLIPDTNDEQQSLLAHADKAIKELPVTLFNQKLKTPKAKISTWRAWQKSPGLYFDEALKDGILDANAQLAMTFRAWLENVFK